MYRILFGPKKLSLVAKLRPSRQLAYTYTQAVIASQLGFSQFYAQNPV